jgi:hypothetical protein
MNLFPDHPIRLFKRITGDIRSHVSHVSLGLVQRWPPSTVQPELTIISCHNAAVQHRRCSKIRVQRVAVANRPVQISVSARGRDTAKLSAARCAIRSSRPLDTDRSRTVAIHHALENTGLGAPRSSVSLFLGRLGGTRRLWASGAEEHSIE